MLLEVLVLSLVLSASRHSLIVSKSITRENNVLISILYELSNWTILSSKRLIFALYISCDALDTTFLISVTSGSSVATTDLISAIEALHSMFHGNTATNGYENLNACSSENEVTLNHFVEGFQFASLNKQAKASKKSAVVQPTEEKYSNEEFITSKENQLPSVIETPKSTKDSRLEEFLPFSLLIWEILLHTIIQKRYSDT